MRVVAIPRDPNPFQENLYRRLRDRGAVVDYLDGPSSSHTVNVVLLPAVLIARRARGYRVLHVHWVFGFVPVWARRRRVARLFRYWFAAILAWARLIGFRVLWTAHNVVPHEPLFDDDVAARRTLVRRCDHVVAMNAWVVDTVRRRFAPECPVSVIPHGVEPEATVRGPAPTGPVRTIAFFGRIEHYKGVDDLIRAYGAAFLPDGVVLKIVGACHDDGLATTLRTLAEAAGRPVDLTLRALDDDELHAFLRNADIVVLPFRTISTSGSLLTAMQSGRPVVVPGLPAFTEIPDGAVVRYEPGPDALWSALERAVALPEDERRRIVHTAESYLRTVGWDEVAVEYARVLGDLLA